MTWKDWVSKVADQLEAMRVAREAMGWELGFKQLADISFSYFCNPESVCCEYMSKRERKKLDELYLEAADCHEACKHPKRPRAVKKDTALYWAWSVALRLPAHFLALPKEEVVAEETVDDVVAEPEIQEPEPKRSRFMGFGAAVLGFGRGVFKSVLNGDVQGPEFPAMPARPPAVTDEPVGASNRKRKRDMVVDAMREGLRAVAAHAVVDPNNPPSRDGAALGTPAFIAAACGVVLLNLARSSLNN